LDDRGRAPGAAAGPAGRLGEELVRPLGGALVRQIQRHVRGHHPDQRDVGDVKAFRDEARPDEHVDVAGRERIDDTRGSTLALDDVAVEPGDAQPRKRLADFTLDALRPATQVADPRRPARRAARRPPTSTWGAVPTGREGSSTRRYSPLRARPTLSTAGVALPRISAALAMSASSIATSRAWSRGVRSLLYAASCSSSTITRPTSD